MFVHLQAAACESSPCRNGGACLDAPGNGTHAASYECLCPAGYGGSRTCGADTVGEVGVTALSLPSRCSSPEQPDSNGLTCGATHIDIYFMDMVPFIHSPQPTTLPVFNGLTCGERDSP